MTTNKRISQTRAAIRDTILAQITGTVLVQLLLQGGILSLLIISLGGTKLEVGAVFMLAPLGGAIRVFFAPYADVLRRKWMLFYWKLAASIVACLVFLAVPIETWFGKTATIWFIIGVFMLYFMTLNAAVAAWFPFIADIIPRRLHGRYFGKMRRAWQISSLVVLLIAGWFLGKDAAPWQFYTVLGMGIVLHFVRQIFLLRLPDPPPGRSGPRESLIAGIKRPLNDAKFMRFTTFVVAVAAAQMLGLPFQIPYIRTDLGFPDSHTVYVALGAAIGPIISLAMWGRITDGYGNRLTFLVSIFITVVAYAVFFSVPRYNEHPMIAVGMATLAFIAHGIGFAGIGIAQSVRMMHEAPAERRATYLSAMMTVVGLVDAAITIVAGIVLDRLPSVVEVFGVQMLTMRVYFAMTATVILVSILFVRRIRPLGEPGIRDTIQSLTRSLPAPLSYPLLPLHYWLRRGR